MIATTRRILLASATTALVVFAGVSAAQAESPVKLVLESETGAKVNLNESNFCLLSECKATGGEASALPGGFGEVGGYGNSPSGVAVDNGPGPGEGNIYVVDEENQRVQEFTPGGQFVLMFGKEVNETTGGNICTEEEISSKGVKCKAGVSNAEAGGFNGPHSVAVDPVSENVYVEDFSNFRVQKFTSTGQFVLMIGKEVNATKDNTQGASEAEKNLCLAGEACKRGVQAEVESSEHGAFNLDRGSILAAGGPNDLLYVGDENRVQEFKPDGTWVHDLSLTQLSSTTQEITVNALALDQTTGDLYLEYYGASGASGAIGGSPRTIFKFDASDKQIGEFVLSPREANEELYIEAISLDSSGHLAVTLHEENAFTGRNEWFGSLLNGETGKPITGFTVLPHRLFHASAPSIAFNAGSVGAGEVMYAAFAPFHELATYTPKVVGEAVTGSAGCKEESEQETSVALDCELAGQINPEGTEDTETAFLWSGSEETLSGAGTQETPKQKVVTGTTLAAAATTTVTGLLPNQRFYYELAAYDQFVEPPERFTGEEAKVVTPIVVPRLLGEAQALFTSSSSAVLFGELNPENAATEYFFEYGTSQVLAGCPGGVRVETCAGVATTPSQENDVYGRTGTTLEATGLQAATEYAYRLSAESQNGSKSEKRTSVGQVGSFTTAPAPAPQANTGASGAVTATTAVVTGTVNPAGESATYAFELGVYNGALTRYGVVSSGVTGASDTPVQEELALSGLQPGTTYAYRIRVESGYGESTGQAAMFTTAGVPAVLAVPPVLAQLALPPIAFPKQEVAPRKTKATHKAKQKKTRKRKPRKSKPHRGKK